ncbi:hypothetical protein LXA43DRAFT_423852 [Ganoderma leucocontextum]|nr:hypothetical protein LXA43DRAFT_423852 [Ganoderma leucocontextum]
MRCHASRACTYYSHRVPQCSPSCCQCQNRCLRRACLISELESRSPRWILPRRRSETAWIGKLADTASREDTCHLGARGVAPRLCSTLERRCQYGRPWMLPSRPLSHCARLASQRPIGLLSRIFERTHEATQRRTRTQETIKRIWAGPARIRRVFHAAELFALAGLGGRLTPHPRSSQPGCVRTTVPACGPRSRVRSRESRSY